MVKFQKQLAGQIVAEWKDGYCDYKQLKRDVKRIKFRVEEVRMSMSSDIIFSESTAASSPEHSRNSSGSPLVAFSVDRLVNNFRFLWETMDNIKVHFGRRRNTADEENFYETEIYETELLHSSLIPVELASEFFTRLDAELNKINKFFKSKEEEYILHAHTLQLQMATLLDLRKALLHDGLKVPHEENKSEVNMLEVWSLQSGRNIVVSKKQVEQAEKLLRVAFADLYRGLGLLKSYSTINIVAFSKILKKYDKVQEIVELLADHRLECIAEISDGCRDFLLRHFTEGKERNRYVSSIVDFCKAKQVVKLMDRVENIFTLHLAKKSHRETLIYLRPLQDTSGKVLSYFQGIFTGCSLAFFSVLLLKVLVPSRWDSHVPAKKDHTKAVVSVSSTVGLVLLHLYMYAWNVYLWRGARVNYALIFEWAPGTELRYEQVLLLSTGLTSLWMLALIVVKLYPALPYAHLAPVFILMAILFILFLPFDCCYRTTRVVFLRCMIRIVSSPLYKVGLPDIFLADQLTSQATALRNIQFLTCYYLGGYFKFEEETACTADCRTFRLFQYIIPALPSWWRLMQCARRWTDEGDIQQVLNGGKYISALIAAAVKVAYVQHGTTAWLTVYVACSLASSAFGVYWDTIRDWGLLQSKSVNPWLRDHLLLEHKRIYYVSMVVNIILRMAWLFTLVPEDFSGLDRSTVDLVLAGLEVIRRGHWNFYRLEYQHLHNFGDLKFLKQIPLPFQDLSAHQLDHENVM